MRIKYLLVATIALFGVAACQSQGTKKDADVSQEVEAIESIVPQKKLKDYGAEPLVLNIDDYTIANDNFRTALWTGDFFQVTLMSIPVGGEVGLEVHNDIEQFLRLEQGKGKVYMGDAEDNLSFVKDVEEDFAVFVPAGVWHNIVNTGDEPMKLYSIYAQPEHDHGTVHAHKVDSDADYHHH